MAALRRIVAIWQDAWRRWPPAPKTQTLMLGRPDRTLEKRRPLSW